ncbi:MAG: tRNA (N(6)-L-threonylcarbamoyladenosine(37)-C(2))-methylthiotransferase MtaB [Lachnospiraceae bacterium]|nr:tRNA (N(6)-L-threonylcarbamoyladenosine(37)-C(2))-methylthiotransferase MtaB [Lachnospiraceae bacterium]
MRKRTVALHNLGCKVNAYETESMQEMLKQHGYEIVDFKEQADVYIINTCSVTNMADHKSRQMLHQAKKRNPKAVIVAAGCYVQTAGEAVKEDLSIDILIGNNQKSSLPALLDEYFGERISNIIDINDGVQPYEELGSVTPSEHTRAFLKVQDGCNQFCSYCIIPYARGRVRSRDPKKVYEEVCQLAKEGYGEIVLTGIHLSSYQAGEDFGLLELIQMLHEIDGIRRIRLGSLEPRIVTEAFAGALSEMPKICPHFHLSLQSGCDETLKRMNRKYDTAEYREKCELLRKYFDHPAITTDVIVGFPGETDEEFARTEQFLRQIEFYEMHVFPYSKRKGTKAATMPDQIPEAKKKERSAVLLSLVKEQSKKFRDHYLNRTTEVLFEEPIEIGGRRYMTGFSKEYVRLALPLDHVSEEALSGKIYTCKVAEALNDEIYRVEF